MSDKVFIDTNIWLYAHDRHDPDKRQKALSLVRQYAQQIVVSTQVMQEFFVGATKKLGIPDQETKAILRLWNHFEVVSLQPEHVTEAIDLKIFNHLSFWDALILSASRSANCSILFTEDLNHGQIISGIRIENPLRP